MASLQTYNPPENPSKSLFKYFRFHLDRDSPSDTRDALLIVAALIAAVTFQAGITPPGGVWQDVDENGKDPHHVAGRSIYAAQPTPFFIFLMANTLGLSASISIITYLTIGFPLYMEVVIASYSLLLTYASAIIAITPEDVSFRYILIAAAVPYLVRFIMQTFRKWYPKLEDAITNSVKG
uniref:PGG domain-containing protein n=1 Tax=Nelumbo nucifera TaxID=4432 RepID=A0A822XS86_NELNU|nr:TPA_asm: hypothetical protein HUJ06_024016 [Nelumbo nucifera]